MNINELPQMNMDISETNCCPKFDPTNWDEIEFELDNKLFVKAKTWSFLHMPLNMGSVFKRVFKNIMSAKASAKGHYLTLSHDPSPWKAEHYFAVEKDVPQEETVRLSGKYIAKVFEGPYSNMRKWMQEMQKFVESKNYKSKKSYFFYTTCPKCTKHYGKNYVVGITQI